MMPKLVFPTPKLLLAKPPHLRLIMCCVTPTVQRLAENIENTCILTNNSASKTRVLFSSFAKLKIAFSLTILHVKHAFLLAILQLDTAAFSLTILYVKHAFLLAILQLNIVAFSLTILHVKHALLLATLQLDIVAFSLTILHVKRAIFTSNFAKLENICTTF